MPPNGVKGFLDDYTLIPSKEDTHTPATCQQCEDNNNAVAYCNTCSHICNECLTAHKQFKLFRLHEIVSYESDDQEIESTVLPKKSYYCTIHPEEGLKLYCNSCMTLVCVHCFVSAHNGHDIRSNDGARIKAEETINELVETTESKLKEFEATCNNMKYISFVEKEKSELLTTLKAQVDKKVDGLIQQLEARRKELLKKIDDTCTKLLKELWAQKEYHETAITSMEGALSFARRALACKEDTELLALCAQVTSRLKELSQLKWDIHETEKIEIIAVEWKPATYFNVSNRVGKISTRSIPTIDIEPIDMPTTFKPGEELTFKVTATFPNTLKNFQLEEDNDVKLNVSAMCSGSREEYTECGYYSKHQKSFKKEADRRTVTKTVTKSQNEWTISFYPPIGTCNISLTLTGSTCMQFGRQSLITTPLRFDLIPIS